jgi:hypothetical protein
MADHPSHLPSEAAVAFPLERQADLLHLDHLTVLPVVAAATVPLGDFADKIRMILPSTIYTKLSLIFTCFYSL